MDYAPGNTPVRDVAGNAAQAFAGQAVVPREGTNNAATARLTVTGTATVGETLTATVSDAADPDGLPAQVSYTFTWLSVEEGAETVISTPAVDPARDTYMLTTAEAGKSIRVRVAFEDYLGNAETLSSDPHPGVGGVAWTADTACAAPDLAGRELVWTASLGVGKLSAGTTVYGFNDLEGSSTLSDTTFSLAAHAYAIGTIAVVSPPDSTAGNLEFSTTADLPTSATEGLALHVCDAAFHFGDGPDTDTDRDASYIAGSYTYRWTSTGLDWSAVSTRRLFLSRADTTAPALRSITVNGSELTMTYDEALEATEPAPSGNSPVYAVSVRGGNPFTLSDIRAGAGSYRNQVTMTLDPPARAGQRIGVTYSQDSATVASRVRDRGTRPGACT